MKTLEEVKVILSACTRHELRDHAFGDCEVTWVSGEDDIANGYFGRKTAEVAVTIKLANEEVPTTQTLYFSGEEARQLRECGNLKTERNDETGPDEYTEGQTMPGLTLEGVRKELTGE